MGSNYVEVPSIYEVYSKTTFLKVKKTMMNKGKVVFSFVTMDESKKALPEKSFDCFMDLGGALLLAQKIRDGRISRAVKVNRDNKGDKKYPEPAWVSNMGGCHEKDGKPALSRIWQITSGEKSPYILQALEREAKTNERGLIVPLSGATPKFINVPIEEDSLLELAECLTAEIYAYKSSHYGETVARKIEEECASPNESYCASSQYEQPASNEPTMPAEEVCYPLEETPTDDVPTSWEEPATPSNETIKVAIKTKGKGVSNNGVVYVMTEKKPLVFPFSPNRTEKEKTMAKAISSGQSISFICMVKEKDNAFEYVSLC